MKTDSLEKFITQMKQVWRPLDSQLVAQTRSYLEQLVKTSVTEPWLAELLAKETVDQELYRDPEHGFLLLAHSEKAGLYRVPHDHGSGWVVYAVQGGEMEMGTYIPFTNEKGRTALVRRESYRMLPGDARVYLPEDIHDTHCISETVLMFRLSSCDLKKESREGRMTRYVD